MEVGVCGVNTYTFVSQALRVPVFKEFSITFSVFVHTSRQVYFVSAAR